MYNISCLQTSEPLPCPVLTNPNPLHHPRVLPTQDCQCHIHARPEWTRPLTGVGIEAARGRESVARTASGYTRLLRVQRSQ